MALPTSGDFLGQAKGLYEPQRKYNFSVELYLPSQRDAELISLSVDSFSLPTESHNRIELDFGNVKRYVPGKVSYETAQMVCKDFVDAGTMRALTAWSQKTYNPVTDSVGLARDCKTTGSLIMTATDGTHERYAELIGVFIDSLKLADMSMRENDINRITVVLSIDKIIPRVTPAVSVSIPVPTA